MEVFFTDNSHKRVDRYFDENKIYSQMSVLFYVLQTVSFIIWFIIL